MLGRLPRKVRWAPSRWGPWEPVAVTDAGAAELRIEDLDNGVAVFLRLRSIDDTGRRSLPTEPVGVTPVEPPAIDPELTTDTLRVTRSQVLAANPAADGGSLVTLDDRVAVEGPGQLLVVEPSPPMPRGMLAEVSEIVDDHPGPGQQLLLTDAALEEVFVDPQIDWEVDLIPQPPGWRDPTADQRRTRGTHGGVAPASTTPREDNHEAASTALPSRRVAPATTASTARRISLPRRGMPGARDTRRRRSRTARSNLVATGRRAGMTSPIPNRITTATGLPPGASAIDRHDHWVEPGAVITSRCCEARERAGGSSTCP